MSGVAETASSRWRRFWDRGAGWKALLVAVAYLALYEGAALVIGLIGGTAVDPDLFANATSVLVGLVLPLVVGAVILTLFVASVGWFGALFARQPIAGRRWMWLAVVLAVVPIVLRLVGIDYARYGPASSSPRSWPAS